MSYPAYLALYESGELKERIKKSFKILGRCSLCPRRCGVNRYLSKSGFCRSGRELLVYSSQVHLGEEPPISGTFGSGTIFFTNCNLRCVYCQNFPFSQLGQGELVTLEKLAEIMINLKKKGCHNINLVSSTHFLPQILESLNLAIAQGLDLPLVYNTNGYESLETLRLLEGIVDIYLPDLRYSQDEVAKKYSNVSDYWLVSQLAIKEMYRQVGNLQLQDGIARRGLIVRHLVLPENLAGTSMVMDFLAQEISRELQVSLMRQYYPAFQAKFYPPLARPITDEEYEEAKQDLIEAGIENGWFQEKPMPEETKKFAGENFSPLKNWR